MKKNHTPTVYEFDMEAKTKQNESNQIKTKQFAALHSHFRFFFLFWFWFLFQLLINLICVGIFLQNYRNSQFFFHFKKQNKNKHSQYVRVLGERYWYIECIGIARALKNSYSQRQRVMYENSLTFNDILSIKFIN